MFSKDQLADLLQLDDGWEPSEIMFSRTSGTMVITLAMTEELWARQECPHCKARGISVANHEKKQAWRHVDGFGLKTQIECTLPHARCSTCRHVFQIKPCWQGKSRHFTKGFEAYALSLLRETSVKSASRVLCESDQRLWRMLFAYVEGVQGELSAAAINILHREWNVTGSPARRRTTKLTAALQGGKGVSISRIGNRENALPDAGRD